MRMQNAHQRMQHVRELRDRASSTHAGESRKRTESLSRRGWRLIVCRSYKLPHSDRNRAVWPDYLALALSPSLPSSVISRIAARLRPGSRNANWPITDATCTPSTPCMPVYLTFWISQFTDRDACLTLKELCRKITDNLVFYATSR